MLRKIVCALLTVILTSAIFMGTAFAAASRSQVLMRGDKDEWVTQLQQALHEKGYLKQKPTGYFGTDTQAAVMAFQKDGKIVVDGKAGPITRKLLLGDAFTEMGRTSADTLESETLRQGDRGDDVTKAQTILKKLEYYDYAKITGYYGTVTKTSVEKFQRTHGLTVDGTINEKTKKLLFSSSAKYYTMYPGDKGDDIKVLQNRLKDLGYFNSSATGYFGSITETAARAFQKNNGLTVDGKVGKNTRAILYSKDAKKASVSSGGNSNSSGSDTQKQGAEKLIQAAESRLGMAYVYGAEGPNTFDCSGLVYYSLRNAGVNISRLSSLGYSNVSSWKGISAAADLKRGDLVFFRSDSSAQVSHVAIYLGGNQIIHAVPSSGKVVKAAMTGYWSNNYVSGRRVF